MSNEEAVRLAEKYNMHVHVGGYLVDGTVKQLAALIAEVRRDEREKCAQECEGADVGMLVMVPGTRQRYSGGREMKELIEQVRNEHATNQCTVDGCTKLATICAALEAAEAENERLRARVAELEGMIESVKPLLASHGYHLAAPRNALPRGKE